MKKDLQCDALHAQYRKVRQLGERYKSAMFQYGLYTEPCKKAAEEFDNETEKLREKILERKKMLHAFLFPEKYGPQVERYEDEPETCIENFIQQDDSKTPSDFSVLRNGSIIAATTQGELALWSRNSRGHWDKETLRDGVNATKVIGLENGDAMLYGNVDDAWGNQAPQYIRQNGEIISFAPQNSIQKSQLIGHFNTNPFNMQRAITPTHNGMLIATGQVHRYDDTVHCTPNQENGTWNTNRLIDKDSYNNNLIGILYQESGDVLGIGGHDIFLVPKQKNGEYGEPIHLKNALPKPLVQANNYTITNTGDLVVTDYHYNGAASVYKKNDADWKQDKPWTTIGWENEPETTIDDIGSAFETAKIKNVTKVSNDTLIFEVLDVKEENQYTVGANDYEDTYLEVYYKNDTGWEKGQLLHGHSPKLDQNGNVLFISDGNLKILRPKTILDEEE